jgi:hypothetical protein
MDIKKYYIQAQRPYFTYMYIYIYIEIKKKIGLDITIYIKKFP